MTLQEWKALPPDRLLHYLQKYRYGLSMGGLSFALRCRQYAIALCRTIEHLLPETVRNILTELETGIKRVPYTVRDTWRTQVSRAWSAALHKKAYDPATPEHRALICICDLVTYANSLHMARYVLRHNTLIASARKLWLLEDLWPYHEYPKIGDAPDKYAKLPARLDLTDYHTPLIMNTVRHMLKTARFEDTPILADMLEDIGCTNQTVLEHLRTAPEHIPGCWVLEKFMRSHRVR